MKRDKFFLLGAKKTIYDDLMNYLAKAPPLDFEKEPTEEQALIFLAATEIGLLRARWKDIKKIMHTHIKDMHSKIKEIFDGYGIKDIK